jgi:hypothetical protein
VSARLVTQKYDDPLSLIWIATAKRLGYRVVRDDAVYASFDGKHTLTISTADHFDADDNLGQMIFHELCHALVAGADGRQREDWGLENVDDRDIVQEHATNRLQAALAAQHGLRRFMATTTDYRAYYDSLPDNPLAPEDDPAIPIAQRAAHDAAQEPWASALQAALRATSDLADAVQPFADGASLWDGGARDPLS